MHYIKPIRKHALCLSAALLLYSISSALSAQDIQPKQIELVSQSTAGLAGNGASGQGATSSNGRFIAFQSASDNLVSGDINTKIDIFLRDRQSQTTIKITNGVAGEPDGDSFYPTISANGQFIAFSSDASNLVSGDTNLRRDAFVYDRLNNSIEMVSLSNSGAQSASNVVQQANISADGNLVTFASGGDLATPSTIGSEQVFVHDRAQSKTALVSHTHLDNSLGGDIRSRRSFISSNGSHIIYMSGASNLTADDNNSIDDYFVYDLSTNTTTLVSRENGINGNLATVLGQDSQLRPQITTSGLHALMPLRADSLVVGDNNGGVKDLAIRDLSLHLNTLVSVASDNTQANNTAAGPSISDDANFISFWSSANNLVQSDTNGFDDVFLRDRRYNKTYRINLNTAGLEANGSSIGATNMSRDGRYIVYPSEADNLLASSVPANTQQLYFLQNPIHPANISSNTSQAIPSLPNISFYLLLATLLASSLRARHQRQI